MLVRAASCGQAGRRPHECAVGMLVLHAGALDMHAQKCGMVQGAH